MTTSDTNKYCILVAKLSKEAVQQVADILAKPPENNKFEALKIGYCKYMKNRRHLGG